MQSALLISAFLLFGINGMGQVSDSSLTLQPKVDLKLQYAERAKADKTIAWVMLAGGTVLAVAGAATNLSNWAPEDKNKGIGVSIIGLASMAGSIPMFISAKKFRRKSRQVM